MYLLAGMVREHVKVVLGGDGGDELFGGYDRYYGNMYADTYARVPSLLRRYAVQPALRLVPDGNWYKSPGHQLKWLHELSFLSGGERYARSLGYFYFGPRMREELYGPLMRQAAGEFDAGAPIREAYERANAHDAVDRMLYTDSQIRLSDHPVMILDRMTMAHGLEARSPFMDHELAEFVARLPVRLKVRGRKLRYVQARLAERYLPPEILARKKQGFSSPLPYMLDAEFRTLFAVYLRDSHLAREGILRQEPINRLLTEHLDGRADNGNRLWLLLNSELWYRMYIEGTSQREMSDQMENLSDHELAR
jgi:asparagine synthase (glutamine-hydrolysing)